MLQIKQINVHMKHSHAAEDYANKSHKEIVAAYFTLNFNSDLI
jgi:hypothetical protein